MDQMWFDTFMITMSLGFMAYFFYVMIKEG